MFDLCCLISGVSTWHGPTSFLGYEKRCRKECEDLLSGIVSKLLASENDNLDLPPETELRDTLAELLKVCAADYKYRDSNPILESMCRWNREVVIIGPSEEENSDGISHIQLRVCSDYSGHGRYQNVLNDGQWKEESTGIRYSGPEPAVFMDSRCWSYLKSWVTLQPLSPEGDSEKSFYMEFWELVKNDFKYDDFPSTKLDYSPLQFTKELDQEHPNLTKSGVKHALEKMCLGNVPKLRQSLCHGIRGKNLGTALLDDFQMWAFESPDIWPRWSEFAKEPAYTTFSTTSTHFLSSLPFELLIEICADMTPYDVLNLASTCRSLRRFLVGRDIFSALLREMVLRGSLRWLNPCPFVQNEVSQANDALTTWIRNTEHEAATPPFEDPEFPFLAFVHICFVHSFSMRSRRRLWEIIKQVEKRWMAVRNGKQLGGEDDPDKWELIYGYERYSPDSEEEKNGFYESFSEDEDGGII
ncbi:hypothetical protein DL96DRAFT_1684814 [Flagelloscypha sp. PMI_526]|nr:hypothetical protein DL96DRAFT_1684814 [Flagelloscypha sp. PMI_526]